MQQGFTRIISIMLMVIIVVLPVFSQEVTPEVDLSLSPTLSPTPTASPTPSPTTSIVIVVPQSAMQLSSPSPIFAEETSEITPEVTEVASEASSETTEVVDNTVSAEITEVSEATEAIEATAAPETTEVAAATDELSETSESPSGTATPGAYTLQILTGEVHYQNRAEQSGISISVFNTDDVLLSVAQTNSRGVFSIAAPADANFVLLIEAPLHLSIRIDMQPNDEMPSLTLAGGDLNADGCINQADLDLLRADYETGDSPASDINADGETNLSDLAILTGNYQSECRVVEESSEAEAQD